MYRGYIYNFSGDEMNHREKILALRTTIELIVKNSANITRKYLADLFGLSRSCIDTVIRGMNDIHQQDSFLYYGERL